MAVTAPDAPVVSLPYIETTVNYRSRQWHDGDDPAKRQDSRHVRVYDARSIAGELSLERNGFALLRHQTAVPDFYDEEQINSIYIPEVQELIKSLTGAERVLVFRWKYRSSNPERDDPRQEGPAGGVHIDYDEPTVRTFLRALSEPSEVEELQQRRLQEINVWRGLTPVECKPLALCDARTVSSADLNPGHIREKVPGNAVGAELHAQLAGYNPSFSPSHRWYYFPHMQPDEVVVLKLCDTDHSRPQLTAHSAIDDPTSPPDAPHRESFEIRTIAVMPA